MDLHAEEAALKAAYQQGFHDARNHPHRQPPPLTVEWGEQPHVVAHWPAASWTAGFEAPMPVFDTLEVPD